MSDNKSINTINNKYSRHVFCTLLSLLTISFYFFFELNSYKVNVDGSSPLDFTMNVFRYIFFAVIIIASSNYSVWEKNSSAFWILNIFNMISVFFVLYFIFRFNSSLSKFYDPLLTYVFIVTSVFLGFNFTSLFKSIIPTVSSEKMWVQKLVAFILISVTAIMVGIILTVYEDNNFNMISLIGGALLSAFFPFLFSDENKKG